MSLRQVMSRAVQAYPVTPRNEWVLSWPGQVVIASSTIHWTAEVTQVSSNTSLLDRIYPGGGRLKYTFDY